MNHAAPPAIALRPPDTVMRLRRLGAAFPTRLSFTRILLRRLAAENARVERPLWDLDTEGYGRAVYSLALGGRTYSLVAFSNRLSDEQRTDRVIAEAWDTTFALFDGVPNNDDLDRLAANVPLQEAGRFRESELVLSRANKSVRFFGHVVDRLAAGRQPDRAKLAEVGYLLRTTAVYGNGKFGIADRSVIEDRAELAAPFQAEMLTVWLIRGFSHDLVEHVARCRAPDTAVPLDPALKRHLGIGNSTGLGMAPFLVNHPRLLDAWITARERALAGALTLRLPAERVETLWQQVSAHLDQWHVPDAALTERLDLLRSEWHAARDELPRGEASSLWGNDLATLGAFRSVDFQELLAALLIEAAGPAVDRFCDSLAVRAEGRLRPDMPLATLSALVNRHFDWALGIDFTTRQETARFWYVSEEKLEPRLGERYDEPGMELESPLDIARQIQAVRHDLDAAGTEENTGMFAARLPQHRHAMRRVQLAAEAPYSEIRDNLIGADCLPIDMLRCKLAFFGASKFDPRSDRWTRITLFQGAPLSGDPAGETSDNSWLPVLP